LRHDELKPAFEASVDPTDARCAKSKCIVCVQPPVCRAGPKCRPARPGQTGGRELHLRTQFSRSLCIKTIRIRNLRSATKRGCRSLELPQVHRSDLGRFHRLAVGAIEPRGEGFEVGSIVLGGQWAFLGPGQEVGEAVDGIGSAPPLSAQFFGGSEAEPGDLYVESAGS